MLDRMHGLHLHAIGSLHAVMPCGQRLAIGGAEQSKG
jgi:hypothetical protein